MAKQDMTAKLKGICKQNGFKIVWSVYGGYRIAKNRQYSDRLVTFWDGYKYIFHRQTGT